MSTFCRSFFLWRYELDILHWSKSLMARTSFWSDLFDVDDTMTQYWIWQNIFCLLLVFVYYQLMLHGTIFSLLFMFGNCVGILLMAPVITILHSIYLWFNAIDNALLHSSGNPPAEKIEDRIILTWAMLVYINLNQMMNETTSLPLQTNSINPVVMEDLALHYLPSFFCISYFQCSFFF